MEPNSQVTTLSFIEDGVRQSFGLVVYTHKTYEKYIDNVNSHFQRLKTIEILANAFTATSVLYAVFGEDKITSVIAAVLSFAALAISIYIKDFDLGNKTVEYIKTANRLHSLRGKYISLLTDIRSGESYDEAKKRRDRLHQEWDEINQKAPRTNSRAYKKAQKALKEQEEFTFQDHEIDKFLPYSIRKVKDRNDNNASKEKK